MTDLSAMTAEELVQTVRRQGLRRIGMLLGLSAIGMVVLAALLCRLPGTLLFALIWGAVELLLLKTLFSVGNPFAAAEQLPLFRRLGDPETVASLLRQGGANVFEGRTVIITDTVVMAGDDWSKMVPFDRLLGVHLATHTSHTQRGHASYTVWHLYLMDDRRNMFEIVFPADEGTLAEPARDEIVRRARLVQPDLDPEAAFGGTMLLTDKIAKED